MPIKQRSVARMNGIVTMIEYTDENDIKAYELEPTYRELTGGSSMSKTTLYFSYYGQTPGNTEPLYTDEALTEGVADEAALKTLVENAGFIEIVAVPDPDEVSPSYIMTFFPIMFEYDLTVGNEFAQLVGADNNNTLWYFGPAGGNQ